MTTSMRRQSIVTATVAGRALCLIAGALLMMPAVANAQSQQVESGTWRITASTGAYVPFSSLIKSADTHDTRLAAGPAFALESHYLAASFASVYANGTLAFGTIQLGSAIRPAVVGPSNQVMLVAGTAGIVFTATDWLGEHVQPTFRLGGGIKWYSLDLTESENQVRPTGDIGLGLRGIGIGAIEVTTEVRYLPSSFDQAKLPTRGIAPQKQRQNDLFFSIGIGIRP